MTKVLASVCCCLATLFPLSSSSIGEEIVSTFDSGSDGWTFTSGVSWQSAGGNPGGYMGFQDLGPATGGQMFAPAIFLGDWQAFDGGTLQYDFAVFVTEDPVVETFPRSARITGPAGVAQWLGDSFDGVTDWTTVVIPIVEDQWQVTGNWDDILANVTELQIFMADSSQPVELTGIDNICVSSAGLLLGDVNCDGQVNLLDVGPFIDLVSSGDYLDKADMNQDGMVNLLDVAGLIDAISGGP